MKRFRRLFTILFITSTILGAFHEIIHHHHHDLEGKYEDSCPVYQLAQIHIILSDTLLLERIDTDHESFNLKSIPIAYIAQIRFCSRSPPLF
jgi:hypothetical protein